MWQEVVYKKCLSSIYMRCCAASPNCLAKRHSLVRGKKWYSQSTLSLNIMHSLSQL